jgi:hypothetical protein
MPQIKFMLRMGSQWAAGWVMGRYDTQGAPKAFGVGLGYIYVTPAGGFQFAAFADRCGTVETPYGDTRPTAADGLFFARKTIVPVYTPPQLMRPQISQ